MLSDVAFRAAATVLLAVTGALAASTRAVSPLILEPNAMTLWTVGSIFTVEWCTDGVDLTGINGTILMGYVQTNGSAFLWKDQPLAVNVSLADGAVNVRCPLNLPFTRRYVVALLGDANNLSPVFTVEDATGSIFPSSTLSPPATLATSGNVTPATITRTSVIGTISTPASTTPVSSTPQTSTNSSAQTTASQGPSSNLNSAHHAGASSFKTLCMSFVGAFVLGSASLL
ncbi:hypothetical protein BC628DRAFT_1435769 [Trametes gibbosa]|nr:hypothetical protein BC628DRAFT_1435769 [Trametes gibbosa]